MVKNNISHCFPVCDSVGNLNDNLVTVSRENWISAMILKIKKEIAHLNHKYSSML